MLGNKCTSLFTQSTVIAHLLCAKARFHIQVIKESLQGTEEQYFVVLVLNTQSDV